MNGWPSSPASKHALAATPPASWKKDHFFTWDTWDGASSHTLLRLCHALPERPTCAGRRWDCPTCTWDSWVGRGTAAHLERPSIALPHQDAAERGHVLCEGAGMTLADFLALLDDLPSEDWDELAAALPELDRALDRLTGADLQRLLADHDQRRQDCLGGWALPMRVCFH